MKNIRIFVVEDDPVYVTDLERMIEESGYTFAGSAAKAAPLMDEIEQGLSPADLVLMDINIKGSINGIELAQKLRGKGIPVIFLSGYDDPQTYQAAQEASPYGYLVKPVKKYTLQSAIESALLRSGDPSITAEVFRLWQENELLSDILFVKVGDKLVKFLVSDIYLIEAEGNYIIIHTQQNRYAVKMSLRQIKQRLSARRFIQVHRKYLVQLAHIEILNPSENELEVNGREIPVGASYRNQLIERINKL